MDDNAVKEKFSRYPPHVREKLEYLRHLIFDVAKNTEGVGPIQETLKWNEPSYITAKTKSGTTIRINWKESRPEEFFLYVNCRTTLIDQFNSLFPDTFRYEGSRAVIFDLNKKVPEEELRICLSLALRYHLDKKDKTFK
ncbi:MAG: DUF1801 domain-containing protein [Cellvibrionaceae bacterium]